MHLCRLSADYTTFGLSSKEVFVMEKGGLAAKKRGCEEIHSPLILIQTFLEIYALRFLNRPKVPRPSRAIVVGSGIK